ncbi:MAG: DNA polymerase III subunit beta, partial [Parcubacteria group bacterium]|nr:DNA polymerase III subunit beta [Parcubacteria group bacterium]
MDGGRNFIMNFSCTKENLYRGLSVVSHITTKNINLPILNNVLIKSENNLLKLITTNLEIATSCIVRGKMEGDGDFTVPAKLFADYINLLPSERVDCNEDNNSLNIKCGNYETKIKGMPATEFPLIPQISKESSHRVYAPDLKRAIETVIFSASTNESRPEISGIFISFNPDGLSGKAVLAATDSYRLAESQVQLNSDSSAGGEGKTESVIIPARTLAELLRVISVVGNSGEANNVVEISIGENQILFVCDGIELSSRLIEGQ